MSFEMLAEINNLIFVTKEMDLTLSHSDLNANSGDVCDEVKPKCVQNDFVQNNSDLSIGTCGEKSLDQNKNNESHDLASNYISENSLATEIKGPDFDKNETSSLIPCHTIKHSSKNILKEDTSLFLENAGSSPLHTNNGKDSANLNQDNENYSVHQQSAILKNTPDLENCVSNTQNVDNPLIDSHCSHTLASDVTLAKDDTLVPEQISEKSLQNIQSRTDDPPVCLEVEGIVSSELLNETLNNNSVNDAPRLKCLSKVVYKNTCDMFLNSVMPSTVSSELTECNSSDINSTESTKLVNHSNSSNNKSIVTNSLETHSTKDLLVQNQFSNNSSFLQSLESDCRNVNNVSELVNGKHLISSKQSFSSSSESFEYDNSSKNLVQSPTNSISTENSEQMCDDMTGDIDLTRHYAAEGTHQISEQESVDPKLSSTLERYISHIKTLKCENESLKQEISRLNSTLTSQEATQKKVASQIRAQFTSKLEKLAKDCNMLQKEKESIVIRYANSEKEVIMEKKAQQDLEKKLKEANKERESLLLKLKNIASENNKLTVALENKTVEIVKLQKQVDKLNGDCSSRDVKIKWLQNKLKIETASHQETQLKFDHTQQRLNEMREEAEQVRRDCQEMIKCYQEAEEIKSVKLDSQLKIKLSELEVQKQEKSDQEQIYQLLRQELEALKKKQRMTMEDNNSLTLKIHSLEKERLEYEQTLSKLKDSQNLLKQEVVDLTARLAEMESLRLQLEREREKSAASLREVERLRLTNAELQADMDACHSKEGELLDFTEKLTEKTVRLQSDHCLQEVKVQALEEEVSQARKIMAEMQQKNQLLVTELENARKERHEEMQLLARKLAEKTKNVEKLNVRLDETENENRVLKRRHIASIKELSRELYQCKRRLESFESNNCIRADSASLGSRTSSTASLDVVSSNENGIKFTVSPTPPFTGGKAAPVNQSKGQAADIPVELDKEMLIERIIKLQKILARKNDKIDFLEDHIEQLIREMRKKSRCVDFKPV
ncbi:coiled-coil domain-containing protein 186-like [Uloborus diversus]|uniref:coiled-coil domain-containing protein 186-like n=1 Tax=Uloborus diversus TaxID=327109 RepID=UPI00240A8438|nr:coiled-coil domain-containing protein 186-like [Uloborus diversus]